MTPQARPSMALMIETVIAMLAASLAIRCLPMRALGRLMAVRPRVRPQASPASIATITRAVHAWSERLPWRTLCFEQGLAAHWLLLRRGCASTLSYGAAQRDGALLAHVWVRSGKLDVIGCENAEEFVLLSQFTNVSS